MKWGVRIMPKPEVLDSTGRTVLKTLQREGFQIENCQVGKYIILDLQATDEQTSYKQVRKVAEKILHNPLTEDIVIEKLGC